MKILIVRHGDPDYEKDSLTPKGWKEAKLLAERIQKMDVTEFYVSPLGRAKDTASFTLENMHREATELEWLQEFTPRIMRPDSDEEQIVWDWLPKDWSNNSAYHSMECWCDTNIMQTGRVKDEYNRIIRLFDEFIEQHGYVRENNYYRAVHANRDTLVLFCHFGLECVLLSRLLNIPPMLLWHGTCAAPTSVTTVVTEERREHEAYFRMTSFGDISHLYIQNEEPAFAARYCETYDSLDERHD